MSISETLQLSVPPCMCVCVLLCFRVHTWVFVCLCMLALRVRAGGSDSAASWAMQSAGFQLRLQLTCFSQAGTHRTTAPPSPFDLPETSPVHSASERRGENCRSYKSPEPKLQAGSFVWLNNWSCDRPIVRSVEVLVPSDGRRARCVHGGVLSLILKYLLSLTTDLAE